MAAPEVGVEDNPNFTLDSDSEEECLLQYIRSEERGDDQGHDENDGNEEDDEDDEDDNIPLAAMQWTNPPDPLVR